MGCRVFGAAGAAYHGNALLHLLQERQALLVDAETAVDEGDQRECGRCHH